MGADGWGPTRVPKPSQPTTSGGLLSDIMRNQRADDRALSQKVSTASSISAVNGFFEEDGTIASGSSETEFTVNIEAGVWVVTASADATWVSIVGELKVSIVGDYGTGSSARIVRAPSAIAMPITFARTEECSIAYSYSGVKVADL